MKIMFVSAANSTHTVRWVNALAERGHEVYLVSNRGHEPKEDALNSRVKLYLMKHSGGKGYYLNAGEFSAVFQILYHVVTEDVRGIVASYKVSRIYKIG